MAGGRPSSSHNQSGSRYSHYDILAIALPIMLSNATVPLIGFADTAVIGQLGETHLIGAVSIASTMFSVLYFVFIFLRMGTTGLTAQAEGAGDDGEVTATLARALLAAGAIGCLLIILQSPIRELGLWLLRASERVSTHAAIYFEIRIWSAPAVLANLALFGWFIGLRRADIAVYLQLLLNGLNILLSLFFVLGLNWSIAGVAAGSVVAEVIAVVVGLWLAKRQLHRKKAETALSNILRPAQLKKQFSMSRDIMIRTVCLQFAIAFFVAQGAQAGDTPLAVNHILFNIVTITIYMLDGFAYAAETLVGQAIGARNRQRFRDAIRLSSQGAVATSVLLSLGLWFASGFIVDFMTISPDVRTAARDYIVAAALIPLTSVWCFMLDGIFIGATATRTMRTMMLISLAFYLAVWVLCVPVRGFGNNGLWIALHAFFLVRAFTLGLVLPGVERKLFVSNAKA